MSIVFFHFSVEATLIGDFLLPILQPDENLRTEHQSQAVRKVVEMMAFVRGMTYHHNNMAEHHSLEV